MGNNFISYFTQPHPRPHPDPDNAHSTGDELVTPTTPSRLGEDEGSDEGEEAQVDPLPDKQCVAWEIDVSDWKPRSKGSKAKIRRTSKANYLRVKNNNALVGGAGGVTSKQTKLVKVTLPTMKSELKMAQCCDDMREKKALDLKRWYCMSRPQYQRSCGITSLVSCWNYLFSSLGSGCHHPITQEEALGVLGFVQPFGEIKFGPFTGNVTLMKWFRKLCEHYGVTGKAYYFYKLHGRGRTCGLTPNIALQRLKDGLQDDSMAFIYHCYNHYFCPIGYEEVAKKPEDAYCVNLQPSQYDTWILIGEPNRKKTGIHWKRWQDVYTDLNCQNPEYFNIRQTEKGVQTRKTKKTGGNIHCIMAFTSAEHNDQSMLADKENNISEELDDNLSCDDDDDVM